MKKILYKLLLLLILVLSPISAIKAANILKNLSGKILLQVESHGEAWYVNPTDLNRYYLANGSAAFGIMRNLGIGISNSNLAKLQNNRDLAKRQSGKIFLQVEDRGQAYYVDSDGNLHYLKNGSEAYTLMKNLGLGITDNNLEKINTGSIELRTTTSTSPDLISDDSEEKSKKVISDIRIIQTALEMYYNDNDYYPQDLLALSQYLKTIPVSPIMNAAACPNYHGYKYSKIGDNQMMNNNYEIDYCVNISFKSFGVEPGFNRAGPAGLSLKGDSIFGQTPVVSTPAPTQSKVSGPAVSTTSRPVPIFHFLNAKNSQPIPGVVVAIPRSSRSFNADVNGQLQIPGDWPDVYATYGMGFDTKAIHLADYHEKNVNILLNPMPAPVGSQLMFPTIISSTLTEGPSTIVGSVVDKDGRPLIKKTVAVHGSSLWTTTDENGNFNLNLIFVTTEGYRFYFPDFPSNRVYYQVNVYKGYKNIYETIKLN